ncbi:hypothetical protein [Kineococcus glutinatus]|uniref:Uncharacterized protein n=1 Tax=Kineococcus glutinatus TaxID=1070872 RepID=A0ABP9HF57_9ACTN
MSTLALLDRPAKAAPSVNTRPAGEGSMFDHLTSDDRRLLRVATGECFSTGQSPRLFSVLAGAIASDRRWGMLRSGDPISSAYLEQLAQRVPVPASGVNPFTGPVLERALAYVRARR